MTITAVKVQVSSVIIVAVFLIGIGVAISSQISWWYLISFVFIQTFLIRYNLGIKCLHCGFPVYKSMGPYYASVPDYCVQCQKPYE